MKDFIKDHKKLVIILGVVLLLVLIVVASKQRAEKQRKEEELRQQQIEELEKAQEQQDAVSDNMLINLQPDLESSYGKAPDGFIWDIDGSLISLGDKSMSAEDVVYAYFRGLSLLDMSTVQRYSRDSAVVETYSQYFKTTGTSSDYTDQFNRDMFKYCLLSLQVNEIENVSVFAENKKVFSVSVNMLDLTNKDFWREDKDDIFNNLYLYSTSEDDSTKSDIYLYDYISNYYKSDLAALRTVTLDVTVQKFGDLDSGWLVSLDSDVDQACQYKDGKLVVSYIKEQFKDYNLELQRSKKAQ